jgi:hypothetical protein
MSALNDLLKSYRAPQETITAWAKANDERYRLKCVMETLEAECAPYQVWLDEQRACGRDENQLHFGVFIMEMAYGPGPWSGEEQQP